MSKNKVKNVTIKDIAKEAGVSIGTISNFFNKSSIVSEELSKKIQKVISKYNYRINVSASSLRGKITKMIGVIIPDSSNLVFSYVIREIEKLAHERGYSIVISSSNYSYQQEIENIEVLKSRNIDGIIIIPSKENIEIFSSLDLSKTPVVLINRRIKDSNIDYVMGDTHKALVEVIDYCAKLGHKKIAFINREPNLEISKERMRGYKEGLKKNNIKFDPKYLINGEGFLLEDGYRDMLKIMKIKGKPTAVIAYNDMLAIGAIKAIKDNNLKVPDDYSVIGYDNSYINNFVDPTLTSVTFQRKEIAKIAFSLIMDRIRGDKSEPKGVIVSSSIVIRDSTAENKTA